MLDGAGCGGSSKEAHTLNFSCLFQLALLECAASDM